MATSDHEQARKRSVEGDRNTSPTVEVKAATPPPRGITPTPVMPKYKRLPVVVEACRWDGTEGCLALLLPWMGKKDNDIQCPGDITFHGSGGTMVTAETGDWIIKRSNGCFDTMKVEEFNATHEKVEPAKADKVAADGIVRPFISGRTKGIQAAR